MTLRRKYLKKGATMIEVIIIGAIVSAATVFVLSKFLSNSNYKAGQREASLSMMVLEQAFAAHPINSMLVSVNTGQSTVEKTARTNELHTLGFNVITPELLDVIKRNTFKNTSNQFKHPVHLATNKQYFKINSTISNKDACAGFTSTLKSTKWTSIAINGTRHKISSAPAAILANLCQASNSVYKYELEFCYATPATPCV